MSLHAPLSCQTCGNSLPPGSSTCPHDGSRVPQAEPVQPGPEPVQKEQDPLVGRQLGEYVVRQRIGNGGMGVVYEGEHTTLGRKVAIKFIREEYASSPHARDLLTEARAASAIRHPGIIDVHDFGHQPEVGQYLVMEYLEGRSLEELIRERAPLPRSEALPLLCEVLDALSAAHAAGVIHRDLKPSNIFLARQSNGAEYIKVLDFGLAKRGSAPDGALLAQTHPNIIIGTPQYMAPEQALCEAVGPQTDLYALGVLAFELLTGQRPFSGRSYMEVVAHHLNTPPPAPSSLVPQPPALDALVLRLLAKEPRRRPASAREAARELRALLQLGDSTPPVPKTVPVPEPLPRALPEEKPAEVTSSESPTVTMSHAPATPEPAPKAPSKPPARDWRWKLKTVAGGALVLWIVTHSRINCAPPASELAASTQPTSPAVATPLPANPEPQPPPALAPPLEESPKPPKKKPSKPVQSAAAPGQQPALAQPAPERPATGTLHLRVRGAWAEVWVDGQKLGRIPPQNRYPLTTGEHELELRNPNLTPYRQKVLVPPNGTLAHTVDFAPTLQTDSSPPP